MLKLINGEIYRLLHKKSTYIYFGIVLAGYFLLAFMQSGGFNAESVVSDAGTYFNFLPALAGGFLFTAIYTDDLNAKNLITLVGYGLSKTKIILAKFILMALCCALFFGLMPLFHDACYLILGHGATARQLGTVYAISLQSALLTLAFATLSGIVVYGLQRTTFAVVAYILLAFSVINTLLTAILKLLKLHLQDHLVSGIATRVFVAVAGHGSIARPLIEYSAYIIVALVLSVLVFRRKEMEF